MASLFFIHEPDRAVELRENSSPVDVSREDHRRVNKLCEPHVHDVHILKIDLRRATRALDHHDVSILRETVIRIEDLRDELIFMPVILLSIHLAADFADYDQLAPVVTRRLEQYRVHPRVRLLPCGLRLRDLRPSHLKAVTRDIAVKRHILALKRHYPVAVLPEYPAERRNQDALPRIRHRALHHYAPDMLTLFHKHLLTAFNPPSYCFGESCQWGRFFLTTFLKVVRKNRPH